MKRAEGSQTCGKFGAWSDRPQSREKPAPEVAASRDGPDAATGRPRSTPSTSSDGDPQSARAYFSGKARVSFRHELDSERDSTS
ncbi:uncharacterized protein C17orf114 homolog isoform X2 [Erythrolamprus reginae]|uniref:uncharacterized protein C17orf114 homolog isoform X2 n=1 Tax=Erythrolamprus reginae TaxID=121349 RepID=UPI00396C511D